MSADSRWQVQKAAYAALSGNAPLIAAVSGVFDFVPQASNFPYVVVSDAGARDWSTKTGSGAEVDLEITVASRGRGRKEGLDIMEKVYDLLHGQTLSLTGHSMINCRFVSGRTLVEEDGLTYRGVMRFRVVTEKL